MPTCEPKRGHLCGNGSLRPAQEKQTGVWGPDPALVSWGLRPPPRLFPHQVGGLPHPCTRTPHRTEPPLEGAFPLSGVRFPVCETGSEATGPWDLKEGAWVPEPSSASARGTSPICPMQ